MEELDTIEALSCNTFKFTTTNGKVYTANPVNMEGPDNNIIVFEVLDLSYRFYIQNLKYDLNIDNRLEEALKKIDLSIEDFKKFLITRINDRKEKVSLARKLREETGCGMMACKKALMATDWVYDKAKEYIKDHPERTYVMFES